MENLSTQVEDLKKKYRQFFLEISEDLKKKTENLTDENFLTFLKEDIIKEIYKKQRIIAESRNKFTCEGCAACCKLACSEFSYDELQQKAKTGDNFAQQFVSVFVPYENKSDAQKIYPEYFELLSQQEPDEKVYFYYCPKVTTDNRCSDYDNRPQICRDFPDNPITFLPKTCGFNRWKEKVQDETLKLRAILEIVEFYKKNLTGTN